MRGMSMKSSDATRGPRTGIAAVGLMKRMTLHREGEHRRTFAFVFEVDEDPVAMLTEAAHDYQLASWQITAVGGFSQAMLGYFDRERREYLKIPIGEQVE